MYNVRVASGFTKALSQIYSRDVLKRINKHLHNLEADDYGFRRAPSSVVEQYGTHLRTLIVASFYIFYSIDEEKKEIDVLHIAYARRNLAGWTATE